jgi:hypothetical protein
MQIALTCPGPIDHDLLVFITREPKTFPLLGLGFTFLRKSRHTVGRY